MAITVQYTGQLANLAGTSEEIVELKSGTTLNELIADLCEKHVTGYSELLLTKEKKIRPSLLVIFDGEQAAGELEALTLEGVSTVMLMTPIAGG